MQQNYFLLYSFFLFFVSFQKQESIQTPKLNVTRPRRALPEETALELVTKVTGLKCDHEEVTKVILLTNTITI